MLTFLRKWLQRSPASRSDAHIVMFTRKDCHLCAEAWQVLEAHQQKRGFRLEKIDVDTSPDLVAKFGACVPAVLVNGTVRFRGRINEVLLERLLDKT
jgi:hypothetical protein